MSFVSLALKEWAVITRALACGEQFLVLRKGGIREQQKRFVLEGNRFLLYPTYEHQSADLLKPQWHDSLAQTLTQVPSPDTVIIDTLAEVVEILEITEPERVTALTDFYICTDDYAQYRLKWRPKHALSIILLRVMKLKRPRAIRFCLGMAVASPGWSLKSLSTLPEPAPSCPTRLSAPKSSALRRPWAR